MYNDEVKLAIEAEFAQADKARSEGYEGRARVCPRRAAGLAIREYVRVQQIAITSTNTYDLLQFIRDLPGLSPDIQKAVDLLLTRVNEEFKLPPNIDLLAEARWLVEKLQSESN